MPLEQAAKRIYQELQVVWKTSHLALQLACGYIPMQSRNTLISESKSSGCCARAFNSRNAVSRAAARAS